MSKKFQTVRGMRDVLPNDEEVWNFINEKFMKSARLAGYHYIQTPILEDAELFTQKGTGGEDLLNEMYSLSDRSDNVLALRPEGTIPVVRSYIEHGMNSLPKPVKLYYFGPMFRYDRPQAGRYRQFNQLGCEVFGDKRPEVDAQLVAFVWRLYSSLGLKNISLQINSIGDESCRPKYVKQLVDHYKENELKICEKCKARLKANPLRVLDCKEEICQPVKETSPQLVDYLDKECYDHFKAVLEFLDEMQVPYELNPYLVRGLDYYTRTTFEIWPLGDTGAQASLGGGGRFDGLVELMGGRPTPAVGFAGGVERLAIAIEEEKIEVVTSVTPRVYIAQLGDKALKTCLRLQSGLLDESISVEGCLDKENMRNQLKSASDLGVDYTLIIGQKEVYDSTVILRDMKTGSQEVIPQEKITKEIKKRLSL